MNSNETVVTIAANNSESTYDDLLSQPIYIIYIFIYVLGIIFGVCGNSLIIVAITMIKELKNCTNMLILNLAVLDLLLSSFSDVFAILGLVLGDDFFRQNFTLCSFIASMCVIICTGSIANLTFLAINRYISICHHKYYKKIFTNKKTIVYAIAIWICGFLHELPNIVGWGGHTYEIKYHTCTWDRMKDYAHSIFFAMSAIIVPFICIFICYVRIYIFVKNSSKNIANSINPNETSKRSEFKKSVKVAKSLFISYMALVLCSSPYGIVILFDQQDVLPALVYSYSSLLGHMYSAINPILYAIFNPSLRRGFKHVLNKVLLKKPVSMETTVTQQTSISMRVRNKVDPM